MSYLRIVERMRTVVEYTAFAVRADGVHEDVGGAVGKRALHGNMISVIRDVALSAPKTDAAVFTESVESTTSNATAGNYYLGQCVAARRATGRADIGHSIHDVSHRCAPTPSRTSLPRQARGGNQNVAVKVGDVPVRVEIQQRHHTVVGIDRRHAGILVIDRLTQILPAVAQPGYRATKRRIHIRLSLRWRRHARVVRRNVNAYAIVQQPTGCRTRCSSSGQSDGWRVRSGACERNTGARASSNRGTKDNRKSSSLSCSKCYRQCQATDGVFASCDCY